ncbi:MAG TPA: hypothetical protein DCE41_35110 [Cytophagales bacterium]|nr:hypothetical protein [Cytophagales bacterium]HAA22470.1 hypothetical protein [Cytophagales bacterium]HAP63325.1 hypothetical protein [Cytophagales bacterium]
MLDNIALLVIGLVCLIVGGEFLVRGASRIALRARLSPLVVGLTIVAFGTSAPELLISLRSALSGSPDMAMGNVIGSNICNLALVLGVTAVVSPIRVQTNSIRIDWPMTMGSSLLLYVLVREGYIDSYEGVLFVTILAIYTIFIVRKSRKDNQMMEELEGDLKPEELTRDKWSVLREGGLLVGGALGLYFGSEWFVGSAKDIALEMGVSQRIIGLTVLALGTSLPEMVTAIVAAMKKQTDIALGNLMGSNIFNILSILGITSMVTTVHVSDDILQVDILWMLGITLVIFPLMLYRRQLNWVAGTVMLVIYAVYIYSLT